MGWWAMQFFLTSCITWTFPGAARFGSAVLPNFMDCSEWSSIDCWQIPFLFMKLWPLHDFSCNGLERYNNKLFYLTMLLAFVNIQHGLFGLFPSAVYNKYKYLEVKSKHEKVAYSSSSTVHIVIIWLCTYFFICSFFVFLYTFDDWK